MTKSYDDIDKCFQLLLKLNGGEDKKPYALRDQACYRIAKNMNALRRHLRDFNTKLSALIEEHNEAKKTAKEGGGGEDVTKQLNDDFNDAVKKLRDEMVEVTIMPITPASLNLDVNPIKPGLIADLMEEGFINE